MKRIIILSILLLSLPVLSQEADIHDLIRLIKKAPVEKVPKEYILVEDGFIVLTGNSMVAIDNNKAVELMKKGDYSGAEKVLLNGLTNAALFFPFRYNLGVCYLYMDRLKEALLHFTKARLVIPEFSKTYIRIGYIYQRWDQISESVRFFREALKRNRREISTFILIGDIYFKRNQLEMASKYYQASLKISQFYPNGLLGNAKILFKRKKYIKARVILKSIDRKGDYDKSFHYYMAESSFILRDFKTAVEHYTKLLTYKNDVFFLTNSKALIEHKLNLSRRISER